MKFAFTTCVLLGRSVIEKIYEMNGKLEFLVTLKDDRAKNKSGRTYIDDIAKKYHVPLIKVDNVNEQQVIHAIKEYDIDWMFIIGWSQIARAELLAAPKRGCIGMHPTLLPKGRGRASIPWAILKGLDKTGVTMFRLDEGVDTGGILGQVEIMLDQTTNATELYRQGRHPKDGELQHDMTVKEAERLVRATTRPYPGAFYKEGRKKIIVWSARISGDEPKGETTDGFLCSDGYLIPVDWEMEENDDD